MGDYGAATRKATWLYTNSPKHAMHIASAHARRLQPHVPKRSLVKRSVDKTGRVCVSGTPDLRSSQAFPLAFGRAVQQAETELHTEWLQSAQELRRGAMRVWKTSGQSTLGVRLRGSARWRDAQMHIVVRRAWPQPWPGAA